MIRKNQEDHQSALDGNLKVLETICQRSEEVFKSKIRLLSPGVSTHIEGENQEDENLETQVLLNEYKKRLSQTQ